MERGYHEPPERLADHTKELHRALASVREELEAIDWYQQRIDACEDEGLRRILEHNRNEEMEHALMGFEWIRRRNKTFDRHARAQLFRGESGPREGGPGGGSASLDIGSLKGGEATWTS